MLGILAFFLGLGSLVLLTFPPIWRDHDGLIQIAGRPNDLTILQYPAAYPFFSRMHVYAAKIVDGWVHHQKIKIRLRDGVILNDAGVQALMITQQVALAFALTAWVKNGARSRPARWCMALLLISNATLFITTNLVSTEALSEVVVIALLALGLRVFETTPLPVHGVIAYALCLYAALMTRHANAIFAMLMPMAYFFRFIVDGIRTRRATAAPWVHAGLFVIVGVICIGASKWTARLLCREFDVVYRPISARATSERLGFVNLMTPPEKESFLASLQSRTDDPVVQEAIPRLARAASWVQQRDEIMEILRRNSPGIDEKDLKVQADAYLDRVASLYFQTHHHYLVQETLHSIWRCLVATNPVDLNEYYLKNGVWSVDLYASDADYSKKTHGLRVCSAEAKQRITALEGNPWVRLWHWVPYGVIFLVNGVSALVFLLCRIGDPARPAFALAITLTGITATCLTFILVNYNPRFTAVANLFALLSLTLIAAHWLDTRADRHPVTAGSPPT
jgi:hypothetical protein